MPPLDPQRIREQSARLRRLAAAIVGDSLADDVLQDVWVAALDGPRREPTRSAAWLTRVTRNLAWRRRIGDSRRRAREERASSSEASDTLDEIVTRIEEGHVIERALLELEEPYRSTLLRRYYDDLSIAEISRRSGRPESTTRTHLQRGLEQLRERMKSEHGPDWRMALLPWLRVERATPAGVSAASALLGGSLMMWLTKSMLVAVAALTCWALVDHLGEPEGLTLPAQAPARQATRELEAPVEEPLLLSDAGSPPTRQASVVDEGRSAASPAATEPGSPARVVEAATGAGVPGLRLRIRRAGKDHSVVSDDEGHLTLPFDVSEAMPHSTGSVRFLAEALIDGSREHVVQLYQRPSPENGALEFVLSDAWAAWVRLPFSVEGDELRALSATSKLLFENDRTGVHPARYAPILTRGRDLLFVVPHPVVVDSHAPRVLGRVLEMSLDAQRGLAVELPTEVSLADEPYLAEVLPLVTQEVLVRSSLTGLPVFGAFVSLREPGRPNSAPVELANGFTDKDGRLTLPSVRPGAALAIANRTGFELSFHDVEVIGGQSLLELELTEPAGKSDLTLSIRLAQGPLPSTLAVTLFAGSPENIAGSRFLEPVPDDGGGWSARTTFEGLPPGRLRIDVGSDLPGLGTQEPIYVELPREQVEIDLGNPGPMRSLHLELPEGVATADFWIEDHGRLRLKSGRASGGARLATVLESRPSRNWMIVAEGYLPVLGRESAWRPARLRGEEVFTLTPRLEPGAGSVVRVQYRGLAVEGAELWDAATNLLLSTTDERGFAVVVGLGEGDRLRVTATGYEPRELSLAAGPLTRCDLRVP